MFPQPAPVTMGINRPNLSLRPIFLDYEARSLVDLKLEGGYKYAAHPSTNVLVLGYKLPDGSIGIWTPLLDNPLSPDECWMVEANPFKRHTIRTYVGVVPPSSLLEAVERGHPLCGNNVYAFDALIWQYHNGLPEPPGGWIDTMFLARAAAFPAGVNKFGELVLGAGKDTEGKILSKLSRPQKNGMFVPLNASNGVMLARYNIKDFLISEIMFEFSKHVLNTVEADFMHQNRIRNMRGLPGDADSAMKMLHLWRKEKADKLDMAAELTDGEITATNLRSPKFLLGWLSERGLNLPNLQKATVQSVLDEYSEVFDDDDDCD